MSASVPRTMRTPTVGAHKSARSARAAAVPELTHRLPRRSAQAESLPSRRMRCQAEATESAAADTDELTEEYNEEMQAKMGTGQTYNHANGMNYDRILPDLIVGSCLQVPSDADKLANEEGVALIICNQRDSDMEYFNLDIVPIQERCAEIEGLQHLRLGIHDFDPFNLRKRLPDVIKDLTAAHADTAGTVYIHCTAGMGRAPATALAYMWWVKGMHLDDAYELLFSKRTCHPKLYAIRQATADILYGSSQQDVTITKRGSGFSKSVKIAGLDIGWFNQIDMEPLGGDVWQLKVSLPAGVFPYKFIMDDHWSYDIDLQTQSDGDNINNVVDVPTSGMSASDLAARRRILADGGHLTPEEHERLLEYLMPKAA